MHVFSGLVYVIVLVPSDETYEQNPENIANYAKD